MRAELTPPPRRTPGGCKQGIPASQNFSMTSPPSLFPATTSSLERHLKSPKQPPFTEISFGSSPHDSKVKNSTHSNNRFKILELKQRQPKQTLTAYEISAVYAE